MCKQTEKMLFIAIRLIGSLCIFAHTGSSWAREWFGKMYTYAMEKITLKKHGYSLWVTSTDRKGTFEPHGNRCENYHHPRHLMLNLRLLNTLVKRNGRILSIDGRG